MRLAPTIFCGLTLLSAPVLSQNSDQPKPFFTWDRPRFVLDRLSIGNSATCRFKHSVITQVRNVGANGHPQVQYASANGDEADTVSFVDLKTDMPKVVSNSGQAQLQVLFRTGSEISLLNREALRPGLGQGTEIYMIFTDSGVILHTTQHRLLTQPSGVTEMGFCN